MTTPHGRAKKSLYTSAHIFNQTLWSIQHFPYALQLSRGKWLSTTKSTRKQSKARLHRETLRETEADLRAEPRSIYTHGALLRRTREGVSFHKEVKFLGFFKLRVHLGHPLVQFQFLRRQGRPWLAFKVSPAQQLKPPTPPNFCCDVAIKAPPGLWRPSERAISERPCPPSPAPLLQTQACGFL